jgi:hypothetical protein
MSGVFPRHLILWQNLSRGEMADPALHGAKPAERG